MIAGDNKPKLLLLQDPYGSNLSYADKPSFLAAGWNLTWYDSSGVALTAQPTWSLVPLGNGVHEVKYTVPGGYYAAVPTYPPGYLIGTVTVGFAASPAGWANEGESYDADLIAGILLTSQGVPAVISADDGTAGDVVEGDSWAFSNTIPLGKLTPYGVAYADLASGWTLSAGFRTSAGVPATAVNSGVGAGNGITADFLVAASGTYYVKWTTFPAAMALSPSTTESTQWYFDVQIKETSTGRILTVARWALRVVWQRDTIT